MVKSGKLTAAELYYIKHNPDGKTIHELAAALDRNPKTIAKYYEIDKDNEKPQTTAPAKPEDHESPMFKLMGRHKRNNQNVATVMTQAASELADETRTARLKEKDKFSKAIHKPIR